MPIDQSEIKTVRIDASGVTYTWSDACTLTARQKADIEASGIRSKKDIPAYLDRCAQLRADNLTWTDATVRAVAKAG